MLRQFLIGMILFLGNCLAFGAEHVVLQLKWEHGFQFAGYYAAKWQGYYEDEGFDVDIRSATREDGSLLIPIEEMKQGRAQFAIGAYDILIGLDQGQDLVILAPFFQKNPIAIYSLKKTPIDSINQLAQYRIAVVPEDAIKIDIETLFKSRGYPLSDIHFVNEPVTLQTLIDNKADAIVTYQISAHIQSEELGAQLNVLYPDDYGLSSYGDTLYASGEYLKSHPIAAQRFLRATRKGWEYALKHRIEMANKISEELPRNLIHYKDIHSYNLSCSKMIESIVEYPQTPLGQNNLDRWYMMNEKLKELGIISSHLDENRIYQGVKYQEEDRSQRLPLFLMLVLVVPVIFYFWYRKNLMVTILLLICGAILVELEIENSEQLEARQSYKIQALRKINEFGSKLQVLLKNEMAILKSASVYISLNPDLDENQMKQYFREIFKTGHLSSHVAVAKDLVIGFIYPLEGNEKALGLDYRKNNEQRHIVEQVVKTGKTLLATNVNLVQGGQGMIVRMPIYTSEGKQRKVWGIISGIIKENSLFNAANINSLANEFKVAIRNMDRLGIESNAIYGDQNIFNDPSKVEIAIGMGGGIWHLALNENGGNTISSSNINRYRWFVFLMTVFLCIFIFYRFKTEKMSRLLKHKIQEDQKLLKQVELVAKIGGWKINQQLHFIHWTHQTSLLIGEADTFQPKAFEDIFQCMEPNSIYFMKTNIERCFQKNKDFDLEVKLIKNSSETTWLRVIGKSEKENNETFVTGLFQDVSDRVLSSQIIEHQATYDSLTNLPNRVLFNDRLINAIENANRTHTKVALLFIDLDHFKEINDNYGHQMGDILLIETSKRIKSCLRESDTVSRLSGDEFGVVNINVNHYKDILKVVEKIKETLKKPFELGHNTVFCSLSIGISIYPTDSVDAQNLLRNADQAMYEVKRHGRNGWQFYTQDIQRKSEKRHAMFNSLSKAIDNDELDVYFQPILDLSTNRLVKCESLVRWKHESKFISPEEFIGLAEETGLVNKIDLFVLKKSIEVLSRLKEKNKKVELSVNVSPRLFHAKDHALKIWMKMMEQAKKKIDVTVEITERLLFDDTEQTLYVLNQLRDMGVKIAIDDFGTGYSSLSYLFKFNVDIIKIDRAFVSEIGKDSSAEALIETILIMAQKLNIEVVAEGIETLEERRFLENLHCHFGQGYLLGKPLSEIDFEAFSELNI